MSHHHTTGPNPGTRRGRVLAATVAAAVLVGVGVAASAGSSPATTHPSASPTAVTLQDSVEPTTGLHAEPTDDLASTSTHPVPDPEPGPQPEPEAPASPGDLELSTNSIDLPDNVYDGNFEVRNDGGSPIEWHWLMGDYGIAVDVDGSTLAPGESVVVHVTINPFQLPEGDFLFANSVYTDDQAKDLHITGHRPQFKVNPGLQQPGLGFTN